MVTNVLRDWWMESTLESRSNVLGHDIGEMNGFVIDILLGSLFFFLSLSITEVYDDDGECIRF